MRIISILVFTSMIWCCTSDDRNNASSDVKFEILPDSLFKYSNILEVTGGALSIDFDKLSRTYTLKPLTSIQRKKYTDILFESGQHYNASFYSKQNQLEQIQPILVHAYADNYNSVLLITVTKKDSVISRLELTDEFCDVIEQHEGSETVFCRKKHATFINDSTVLVFLVKDTMTDSVGRTTSFVDSLTFVYRILSSGSIRMINNDSTRYFKPDR